MADNMEMAFGGLMSQLDEGMAEVRESTKKLKEMTDQINAQKQEIAKRKVQFKKMLDDERFQALPIVVSRWINANPQLTGESADTWYVRFQQSGIVAIRDMFDTQVLMCKNFA